ncbi:MAG: hypothetical protein EXR81_06630 [Gammaproteobacteria bacterium]|nr:hypothetical protein [Gammaproteobacteria bacterium]
MPKGFPVNTANACANVTLAPQGSCVLASASAYLVSSDSPAAWSVLINDGFESFSKTISYPVSSGVDAVISALPKNMSIGESAPIHISVVNHGDTALKGFSVNLPNIEGLTYNQNTCSSISILGADQSCAVSATFAPVVGSVGAVSITATVEYNGGATIRLETDTNISAVSVKGSVDPETANVSIESQDAFTYTFANTSPDQAATEVKIALPNEPGLTQTSSSCGTTIPAERSCTVEMVYTPPVGTQGLHTFAATLTYAEGDAVQVTHNAMVSTIPVNGTVNPKTSNVSIGSKDIFTYTFSNMSDTTSATAVHVRLPAEPGLTFEDAAKCEGSIKPGQHCSIVATYIPPVGSVGTHIFRTILSYAEGGDVVLKHTTAVSAVPVNGTVTPASANVSIGETDQFTYVFANRGTVAATGVNIVIPAEPGLTITNYCGASIAAGANCVVKGAYKPPVGSVGTHVFMLALSYDQGGDLELAHTATVSAVPVNGIVTADSNLSIGQTDQFTYVFTNRGTVAATGVKFVIPAEPGLTITNYCGTSIAAGDTCGVWGRYTPPIDAQGTHVFMLALSYDQGGDIELAHTETVSAVPVNGTVNIVNTNLSIGQTDQFTYTFANQGTVAATGVKFVIPAEPGLTITNYCGASIAAGTNCVVKGAYKPPVGSVGTHVFMLALSYDQGGDIELAHTATVSAVPVNGTLIPPLRFR